MLIQIILVVISSIIIGVGIIESSSPLSNNVNSNLIAQKTAYVWHNFAEGLNSYVKQNESLITGSEIVTCQQLEASGYYSANSCLDPVGETLEGVIAAPYGFPQSWGVIAASKPSPSIMATNGLGSQSNINAQSLNWHKFDNEVSLILQKYNLVTAVYNSNTNTFKEPFGTGVSNYSNYSLPATPITYGVNIDGVGPDGLMAFPQLHKEPGYWLWQAQMLDEDTNSTISFVNYGYSLACPANGVIPVSWNSSPWVSTQNNNNIMATNFYWAFSNSAPGIIVNNTDPSNQFNYKQFFVCVPSLESTVNTSTSYDPFQSTQNNLPNNITNPSYATSTDWNGDPAWTIYNGNNGATQDGATYYISIGGTYYTLVTYAGNVGGNMPGGGYYGRLLEMAFYQKLQSQAVNVEPSLFGGSTFNNQNGFYAPPTTAVPSYNINLP
jgi:hypothetical protein